MRKDGEEDGRVTSQDQHGGKKVGKNDIDGRGKSYQNKAALKELSVHCNAQFWEQKR